ncbi:hypothetical protein ACFVHW_04930 [Streptomyces sp. NPDC127110]|uniref:hypothetical protein n=1 Tax=Streptomyces sp. NPDC127110 TaxID=3345362 RepID=UPI00363DAC60
MSRTALLEPPCTDQDGARLARTMPGDAPPVGLSRMLAGHLPMAGAMHRSGRHESGGQLTPPDGGRHA